MTRPLCFGAIVLAAVAVGHAQPAATLSVENMLVERLGLPAADVQRFSAGSTMVWPVPATADNEIAAVGALRAKGDLRRIVAWLRDIEAFIKAAGTENVGAIATPATPADMARVKIDAARDGAAERARLGDIIAAYQSGGDAALDAVHARAGMPSTSNEFQDMLRRSTRVWDLAYPFVSYLDAYPKAALPDAESRFYWTNDKGLTLHHVVLQPLSDGRVLVADKQFYASRDLDAALMLALGVPHGTTSFDLVVSVKARANAMRGVAGRMLRGRIEKEIREGLAMYLDWIRGSAAL